jgi:hypothetical protein
MEQQARAQQLDLLVLATGEIERQRLNPASRSEIIILFQALLSECGPSDAACIRHLITTRRAKLGPRTVRCPPTTASGRPAWVLAPAISLDIHAAEAILGVGIAKIGSCIGVHPAGALDVRLDHRIGNAFEVVIAEGHESVATNRDCGVPGVSSAWASAMARKYSNACKSSCLTPSPAAYMRPSFHWAIKSPVRSPAAVGSSGPGASECSCECGLSS